LSADPTPAQTNITSYQYTLALPTDSNYFVTVLLSQTQAQAVVLLNQYTAAADVKFAPLDAATYKTIATQTTAG
jgi:hypothetical protein